MPYQLQSWYHATVHFFVLSSRRDSQEGATVVLHWFTRWDYSELGLVPHSLCQCQVRSDAPQILHTCRIPTMSPLLIVSSLRTSYGTTGLGTQYVLMPLVVTLIAPDNRWVLCQNRSLAWTRPYDFSEYPSSQGQKGSCSVPPYIVDHQVSKVPLFQIQKSVSSYHQPVWPHHVPVDSAQQMSPPDWTWYKITQSPKSVCANLTDNLTVFFDVRAWPSGQNVYA